MGQVCSTKCGTKATTLKGKSFCVEVASGMEVSDAKCKYWKQVKPKVPTQKCAATARCVEYKKLSALDIGKSCSTACGQSAKVITGKVYCAARTTELAAVTQLDEE